MPKAKKTTINRRVLRVDFDEVCKFAANLSAGGFKRNTMTAATELLKQCVYASKGVERYPINDEDVTKLIAKGYALTE
jgi:hypothetical protein